MAVLECRVLQKGKCEVSQRYKGANHNGIDLVGGGYTLDNVVAHSDGTVVGVVNNCNRNTSKTGEKIYGNYVKIKHDNGMYTFYAHLKYGSVAVNANQRVTKGQVLGAMGNTGYSFGSHLHFEVRNEKNVQVDPTPYVGVELPQEINGDKTATKSVEQLAREVIAGGWGNGEDRKRRLTDAGYNYNEVQNKVNEMLSGKATTQIKPIDELAKEVIRGEWGNGADRKNRLIAAGYDYNAVQNRVNQLLK